MDENQRQDWWPDEHPADTAQDPEQHTQSAENEQAPEPAWQEADSSRWNPASEQPQNTDNYRMQNNQQDSDNQQQDSGNYRNQNNQQTSDNYWNQYNQQNPNSQPNPGWYPQRHVNNGMAIASLFMGILSIVMMCCGFSFFFGALGILFALLSRKEKAMDPQAKIGLGLSIGGTVMSLVLIIVALAGNSSYYSDFIKEYQRFYNEYEDESPFPSDGPENFFPDPEDFEDWYFKEGDWYFEDPNSGDSL